ncbi:hypothetical protein DBR06_SOUSAS3110086 [Sousa chinensis]|nr:hypothetical protein DBR06_SOUSAS3110086 [Sousa chinensis]
MSLLTLPPGVKENNGIKLYSIERNKEELQN